MAQVALAERIGGIADFALAAHKDQDIARAFVPSSSTASKIACS
jgi:hypothetical protein